MLSTWILAVCFSADTTLTADAIMQRVIENQTRALEARKQWVYTQEVLARSTQRNKTLRREETRTFRVLPLEKSTQRELLTVAGQRRVKNKLEVYDRALSNKEDDGIDEWVSDLAEGKEDHDESKGGIRDAFGPNVFPLADDKLKGLHFHSQERRPVSRPLGLFNRIQAVEKWQV